MLTWTTKEFTCRTEIFIGILGYFHNIPDWSWKSHKSHHYRRVKTSHVHPATCNLAHWLTTHGSPTIYRCFALPKLLYRWRHHSDIFWIHWSVTPCSLVLTRESDWLIRRLVGPHGQSGPCGVERSPWPFQESDTYSTVNQLINHSWMFRNKQPTNSVILQYIGIPHSATCFGTLKFHHHGVNYDPTETGAQCCRNQR
jgi:hypothetical protein